MVWMQRFASQGSLGTCHSVARRGREGMSFRNLRSKEVRLVLAPDEAGPRLISYRDRDPMLMNTSTSGNDMFTT